PTRSPRRRRPPSGRPRGTDRRRAAPRTAEPPRRGHGRSARKHPDRTLSPGTPLQLLVRPPAASILAVFNSSPERRRPLHNKNGSASAASVRTLCAPRRVPVNETQPLISHADRPLASTPRSYTICGLWYQSYLNALRHSVEMLSIV